MPDRTQADYSPEETELVKQTLLHVAIKFGDLQADMVLVGGSVPLLLPGVRPDPTLGAHVGTRDLDVGLSIALLDEERYAPIPERLDEAGFEPSLNENGKAMRWQWQLKSHPRIKLEFLIAPTARDDPATNIKQISKELAAMKIDGLDLAHRDHVEVPIEGKTPDGTEARRVFRVCNAGPFVVLKALAIRGRDKAKDAYDLYYVVRNFKDGPSDVARALAEHRGDANCARAIEYTREDFAKPNSVGPRSVARFLGQDGDEDIGADAVGFVQEMLAALDGKQEKA